MKIALAQTNITWEKKEVNIARAERIISESKKQSIELMLFPEMSFTGFSMNTSVTAEKKRETVLQMSGLASKYELSIGFGWVRAVDKKSHNVYTIVDAQGNIVSQYVKIHPFSYSGEDIKFLGGEEINLYYINDVPFSTFICYDLRFPELFRAVANEIHAVIVPACWPAKRAEHWKALLRARAVENQIYIFAVNCYGDMGEQYYSGDSCVINPDGEVLTMLSDTEGVITYDFNDDVEKYRSAFPVLRDRKVGLYKEFLR